MICMARSLIERRHTGMSIADQLQQDKCKSQSVKYRLQVPPLRVSLAMTAAAAKTIAPRTISSSEVSSAKLCEMPSMDGINIMAVGITELERTEGTTGGAQYTG